MWPRPWPTPSSAAFTRGKSESKPPAIIWSDAFGWLWTKPGAAALGAKETLAWQVPHRNSKVQNSMQTRIFKIASPCFWQFLFHPASTSLCTLAAVLPEVQAVANQWQTFWTQAAPANTRFQICMDCFAYNWRLESLDKGWYALCVCSNWNFDGKWQFGFQFHLLNVWTWNVENNLTCKNISLQLTIFDFCNKSQIHLHWFALTFPVKTKPTIESFDTALNTVEVFQEKHSWFTGVGIQVLRKFDCPSMMKPKLLARSGNELNSSSTSNTTRNCASKAPINTKCAKVV